MGERTWLNDRQTDTHTRCATPWIFHSQTLAAIIISVDNCYYLRPALKSISVFFSFQKTIKSFSFMQILADRWILCIVERFTCRLHTYILFRAWVHYFVWVHCMLLLSWRSDFIQFNNATIINETVFLFFIYIYLLELKSWATFWEKVATLWLIFNRLNAFIFHYSMWHLKNDLFINAIDISVNIISVI